MRSPPTTGRPLAAQLAAGIPIPTRLPVRFDGRALGHLSSTSYTTFPACPEKFGRRCILGEREPTTGQQFLGRRVDDALTVCYARLMAGERLSRQEVQRYYRGSWKEAVERTRAEGLVFDTDEQAARATGLMALRYCFEHFVPNMGRPTAVQRQWRSRSAPASSDRSWG